jgi:AcrR family transcriptional regulator
VDTIDAAPDASRTRTRDAIVEVAAGLLDSGGVAAVTTRAVATAAGVQAPTIYRLFGDKDGLLDAVAEHVFVAYIRTKALGAETDDPVADLDAGWATHIGFGLANPALFVLMSDPDRGTRLVAGVGGGEDILRNRVHRVALAGRLAVTERRAVEMIRAAGTGVVHTLLTIPPADRDLDLVEAVYGTVKRAIIADAAPVPLVHARTAAIALRANLADITVLSPAEHALMVDWLDRIAAG